MAKLKLKIIGKEILSKLPIFLFCIIFIKVHNEFFGEENSIVAISLLIGIFMLLKGDFEFNVKQASCCIPLLYLLIVVGSKLSHTNPFVGLIVNIICISLILIITRHNLNKNNHVPFMMAYLFCQGYNTNGHQYSQRIISIIVGSLIITLIYYFANRKNTYDNTIFDFFKEINIKSPTTQWCLKLIVPITLNTLICDVIAYPRTMWINLAILSLTTITTQDDYAIRKRSRIPATILGTIVFFILFDLLIPLQYQPIFILLGGFLSMFMGSYFIKTIYNSFSALVSAALIFATPKAIFLRILSNIVGVIIAVFSNLIFEKLFSNINEEEIEFN